MIKDRHGLAILAFVDAARVLGLDHRDVVIRLVIKEAGHYDISLSVPVDPNDPDIKVKGVRRMR